MQVSAKRALFILLWLLATAAHAASPSWTPLGPFGGTVREVLVDPLQPATLYAAGDFPAIVKSTDAGLSWTVLPGSPDGAVMAIDSRNPRTLYASTFPSATEGKATVAKSVDGGAHWTLPAPGFRFFGRALALAVDPARSRRIYLGTSGSGLFKSENGGASWAQASQGFPAGRLSNITALAAVARPAGTAYAGTFSLAVFKTTNGGASWTPASNGLPGGQVLALAAAPSDAQTLYVSMVQGIFRTTDGGRSWTPAGAPDPSGSPVVSLAVDPRSPRTVWAGGPDGLLKTVDGGAQWEVVTSFPYPAVTALAVAGTKPAAVYAGVPVQGTAPGGILRSADGGATWQSRRRGIPGLDTLSVAADPRDPAFLAAGTNGLGLFLREQEDGAWVRSSLGFPPASDSVPAIRQVLFSPEGAPEALYALLGSTLAVSTDRGGSWSLSDPEAPQGEFKLLSQDPEAPFHLFALTTTGLWSGLPGAWTPLSSPCACDLSLLAVARGPVIYAADGFGSNATLNIFRSADGGASWVAIGYSPTPADPVVAIAVDPLSPNVVFGGHGGVFDTPAPGGLYRTRNGGQVWIPMRAAYALGFVTALAVSPVPGRVYLANAAGQVFRSTNGGANWSPLGTGLAVSAVHQLLIAPDDPRHLYAATSGGVWEIEDEE